MINFRGFGHTRKLFNDKYFPDYGKLNAFCTQPKMPQELVIEEEMNGGASVAEPVNPTSGNE